MASVKLPTFPSVDLSKFDLSKISVPKISVPTVETEAVSTFAKDTAYVAIGLAVVAVQKAQVRRREIAKSFSSQGSRSRPQLDDIMSSIEARLASIDSHIESLEGQLDVAIVDLEKRLPERAGAMLVQAHDVAKAARKQVRGLIVTAA